MYSAAQSIDPRHFAALRRLNLLVGLTHLVQAAVMLGMSGRLWFPVTASFLEGDPVNASLGAPQVLFEVPYGTVIALYLAVAATDHLLVVTPQVGRRYNANLARGTNPYRWYEYSVSASLMVVLIAMLVGIRDIAALVGLFGLNASMIWFGLLMERQQPTGPDADRLAFWLGSAVGVVPWLMIAIHVAGANDIPAFFYVLMVSVFALFGAFAVVMYLHSREVGRFSDTIFYERAYIWLSFGAKSALAWQLFANVLRA